MSVNKLLVGAAVVALTVAACNKNPRSEVRNRKERNGTGQTGMVSTKHSPEDTVEGKPVPLTAAIQPTDLEVINAVDTMASDGGMWTTADAGGVSDAGVGTTTIDAGTTARDAGGLDAAGADAAIDAILR
jgi:hypothetical protein